jgi:hypothetical protein
MMIANKNTVFEHWLQAYGSHLEELAGTKLSGAGQTDRISEKVEDQPDGRTQ